jgi:Protein of unknown function (DUF4236)
MGWRFYRRFKILPGVTLNLSKKGASVSVGIRGAHLTAGRSGIRETIGLPGTGVSYTKHTPWWRRRKGEDRNLPELPLRSAASPPARPSLVSEEAVTTSVQVRPSPTARVANFDEWHWVPPEGGRAPYWAPRKRYGVLRKLRNGEFRKIQPKSLFDLLDLTSKNGIWNRYYEEYLDRMQPGGSGENYPGESEDVHRLFMALIEYTVEDTVGFFDANTSGLNVRRTGGNWGSVIPEDAWAAYIDGRVPAVLEAERTYAADFHHRMANALGEKYPGEVRDFAFLLMKTFARAKDSDDWREREFDSDERKSHKIVVYSLLLAFFGIAVWIVTSYQTQPQTSQSRTSANEVSSSTGTGVTTRRHHHHHSAMQTTPAEK